MVPPSFGGSYWDRSFHYSSAIQVRKKHFPWRNPDSAGHNLVFVFIFAACTIDFLTRIRLVHFIGTGLGRLLRLICLQEWYWIIPTTRDRDGFLLGKHLLWHAGIKWDKWDPCFDLSVDFLPWSCHRRCDHELFSKRRLCGWSVVAWISNLMIPSPKEIKTRRGRNQRKNERTKGEGEREGKGMKMKGGNHQEGGLWRGTVDIIWFCTHNQMAIILQAMPCFSLHTRDFWFQKYRSASWYVQCKSVDFLINHRDTIRDLSPSKPQHSRWLWLTTNEESVNYRTWMNQWHGQSRETSQNSHERLIPLYYLMLLGKDSWPTMHLGQSSAKPWNQCIGTLCIVVVVVCVCILSFPSSIASRSPNQLTEGLKTIMVAIPFWGSLSLFNLQSRFDTRYLRVSSPTSTHACPVAAAPWIPDSAVSGTSIAQNVQNQKLTINHYFFPPCRMTGIAFIGCTGCPTS